MLTIKILVFTETTEKPTMFFTVLDVEEHAEKIFL